VEALCRPGGPLEAMDSLSVESVVIMKGAQTAVTTTTYAWLAKSQAVDPSSALIVMPSANDARDKSKETWQPMFEDSHKLQRYMPTDRRRDWTATYQRINGAGVYWVGANSPSRLASKPIRRLILDEEDKFPRSFGLQNNQSAKKGGTNPEAGAAALAIQRTKTYKKKGQAKIIRISTPTDDTGGIAEAYSNGDQRKLKVPCIHCGTMQILEWKNFKIDMDLAKLNPAEAVKNAHYLCPHCHKPWTDEQRWNAIDNGIWEPTEQARDPKCQSFWFPAWLSKFVTTSYLATGWLKAQTSKSCLQDFVNAECGQPYVRYDNRVLDSEFLGLEGEYAEGTQWLSVPLYSGQYDDPSDSIILAGVDVQKNYLVATFRQYHRSGDSGLLWNGTVESLTSLEKMADQFGAKYIFIDQRYRTREIQEFAYAHQGYVPCQGVTTRARSIYSVQTLDIDVGKAGQGQGREITTLNIDPNGLKDILVELLKKNGRRWLVPTGYSGKSDYCQQMSAERCVNGIWLNPLNRPEHSWDTECLCLCGAIWTGFYPVAIDLKIA